MQFDLTDLDVSWQEPLQAELKHPYMQSVQKYLSSDSFYPAAGDIFRALGLTPLNEVKVVILGQDPYHGEGQATGLAFSVDEGVALPPSLRNIFKELRAEYPDYEVPQDASGRACGDLSGWARQGVLLLNTALTVHPGEAGSHSSIGWHILTGKLIELVSSEREGVVFVLWGAHAQSRRKLIDESRHTVIATAHPSPLSAYRGFFGSGCFQKVNEALEKAGLNPVNWQNTTNS